MGALILLSACQTIEPPPIDDTRGPKPTELRKHVIEVLDPSSFTFRASWYSQIGDIDDQTQMVMSDVLETVFYISGGFTAKTFKSWHFCVSLINPPEEPRGDARVGVMTINVKNGEGKYGNNYCRWYDPTPEYKEAVDKAIAKAEKLTKN